MASLMIPLDKARPYVVTGSASGIGAAVAEMLAADGATVVTVDLDDDASTTAERIHIRGDVADVDTWDRVADTVATTSSDGAAGLITCAGAIAVSPLAELTASDFERLFRINALGVLHGIQRLIPAMADRGDGSIVAVASVDSLFAEDQMSAYATSKGALLQLIRSTAVEYARHGVRVNAVCPGAVATPLLQQHLTTTGDASAAARRIENVTPVGRLLTPTEIANVLLFLSSPLASAVSGAAVVADGGVTTTYDFRLDG